MKSNALKILIKSAVKEAIREEMKDILLEALRSNKPVITEQITTTHQSPEHVRMDLRNQFLKNMEMGNPVTTSNMQTFTPTSMTSTIEGALPPGEVSLDQMLNLLK
jgi:hypothetical protein